MPHTVSLQDGDTALIIAAWNSYTDIVRELLSSRADVNQIDQVSDKNTTTVNMSWCRYH